VEARLSRTTSSVDTSFAPGKRSLTEQLSPAPHTAAVQQKANAPTGDTSSVHAAAEQGIAGSSTPLPFANEIQRAFGHHDISGVQAHTDGAAAAGAGAMGAQAFATGNHIAFAGTPDLRTAAHEAAHVVQQRGGVQLKGGVGAVGDTYEQHADSVADRVVAGESAQDLLDQHAPAGGGRGSTGDGAPVQHFKDFAAVGSNQEAIRPDEERKFVGKPVVAKGLLFAECPPPPDGRAYPRGACLHIGLKVLERSMYDFLHGPTRSRNCPSAAAGLSLDAATTRGTRRDRVGRSGAAGPLWGRRDVARGGARLGRKPIHGVRGATPTRSRSEGAERLRLRRPVPRSAPASWPALTPRRSALRAN
jgi:hypothetical protein